MYNYNLSDKALEYSETLYLMSSSIDEYNHFLWIYLLLL